MVDRAGLAGIGTKMATGQALEFDQDQTHPEKKVCPKNGFQDAEYTRV